MKHNLQFNKVLTLLFIAVLATFNSIAQTITTIAGTGVQGYSGDNGPAISAQLKALNGQMTTDASGNIYFTDTYNHAVRKIDITTGTITTIAGTGTLGFSGDGGSATLAQLAYPQGVAIDNSGNIYICDSNNDRVRKISPSGTITTICGNGTQSSTGDGGLATAATVNRPGQICFDPSGNMFITEYQGHRIREIATTGTITTYAGTGVQSNTGNGGSAILATFSQPYAIASDAQGNIYVSAYNGNNNGAQIRKIATNGTITAFACTGVQGYSGDGGPAVNAQADRILGIYVNNLGEVLFSDLGNSRIRKVASTGTITTFAGTGTWGFSGDGGSPTSAQISYALSGITGFGCNTYFLDSDGARIRKVLGGTLTVTAVSSTSLLCVGQTASLTASGASTYTWNTNATTSVIAITPTITTNYTVTGTGANGCINSTAITQSVSACTGIDQLTDPNIKLIVYPNPFINKLTVISNEINQPVLIYNALGSTIYSSTIETATTEINLSNQANGIYYIKIGTATKKLIKE